MKKKMKRIISILLVCALLVPLAACGGEAGGSGDDSIGPIVISIPAATHGWMAAIAFWSQYKVDELDLANGIGYRILTAADVIEQAGQIEDLLALNPSAMVLLPHNSELSIAANAIEEQGVPMILFDRRVYSPRTAYVAGDNVQVGRYIASGIVDTIGTEGIVALMNVPGAGTSALERVQGFHEVIDNYPNIQVVNFYMELWTQEHGLQAGADLLVAHSHIDAIASINCVPSLSILQAIREAGRTEIQAISGAGGWQPWIRAIYDNPDMHLFTATYFPSMIKDAIQVAYDLVHGAEIPETIIVPPTVITRANAAQYFNDDTPY